MDPKPAQLPSHAQTLAPSLTSSANCSCVLCSCCTALAIESFQGLDLERQHRLKDVQGAP